MADIMELIPFGRENAVKGRKLAEILGVDERTVREMVTKERNKGSVIINVGGGNRGYFKPILPDELEYVNKELDTVMGRYYSAKVAAESLVQTIEIFDDNLPSPETVHEMVMNKMMGEC